MKKLYIFLAISSLAIAGVSCIQGPDQPSEISGPHFTLTVEVPCSNVRSFTKAEMPNGVQSLNENLVNSIYYYFFPESDGEAATPSISGHFLGLSIDGDKSEDATKTWKLPVSANVISNELFPSGTKKCRMFIVANPPSGLVSALESAEPTLGELRALSFTSNLAGTQDNFVMVCDDLVEEETRTGENAFTAVANLKRVANKMTLNVRTINEYIDPDTGDEWKPALDGLTVEFYNGMNKANLEGNFSALSVSDDDYFMATSTFSDSFSYEYIEIAEAKVPSNITPTEATTLPTAGEGSDQYVKVDSKYYSLQKSSSSETPLYTYPMAWDFADQYEPYLLFDLPWEWTYDDGGTSKTVIKHCYYKLTLSQKSMATNGWYCVTVDLKAIGSFYKVDPVQEYLYEDYIILDWNNAYDGENNNVDADIKEARFLVVSTTDYVLNNQIKLSIPFASSHDCEIQVTSATRANFSSGTPDNFTTAAADWFEINGSVLEFEHELDNRLGATMDYAPYLITLVIRHIDKATFSQEIHITQYPAIYADEQRNSGANNDSSTKGYTYVNGSQSSSGSYGGIYGSYNDGTVNNPNMTIITVTQFGDDVDYIIGDPRTPYVHNLNNNTLTSANTAVASWSTSAPGGVGGSNRRLTYYYPTDPAKSDYIAPKLRVVSSYSRLPSMVTYADAMKRCASWQEDGYPAGRWRMPTKAEVQYIVTLSNRGFIKPIFYTNQTYFYAGGSVQNGSTYSTDTSGSHLVRCVYDEWYWDVIDKKANNKHTTKTFYWGDQER